MAEQRENSVLLSLREVRRMEDQRVHQEEAAIQAKADAERQAREDGERRIREEADRKRREEEDRLRRVEEDRLSREREEQLRLQEAERRARVEGETQLQQERMRLEISHRKAKSPMPAIAGVAAVVVLIAGGVVFKLYSDHKQELQAAEQETIRIKQEGDRKAEAERRLFETRMAQLEKQLATSTDEAQKAQLRVEMEKERARRAPTPTRREPAATPSAPKPSLKSKRPIDDDPLGGIKL